MVARKRFTQEIKDQAVKALKERRGNYPSNWAAICAVANEFGCSAVSLRNWVDAVQTPKDPEKIENEKLRTENKALKKQLQKEQKRNALLNDIHEFFSIVEFDRPKKGS